MKIPFWAVNLRKARKLSKLTQKEVADRIYKSQQAYDKYEKGETEPDVETWKLLWDMFRIEDPLKFWTEDYYTNVAA
jgi:transcriptional regulator with XRE-family HTH domain